MAEQRSEVDLIEEFCRITGCDHQKGYNYLSTRNWDLDEAVSYYFDNPTSSPDSPDNPALLPAVSGPPPPKTTPSRIATLSSILSKGQDEEEEGQAFYAGGSERSGQQVLGPSKKNYPEIIEQMFKAAQRQGAQLVDPVEKRKQKFQGQGHRLGTSLSEETSAPVASSAAEEDTGPVEVTLTLWQNGFQLDSGPLRPYSTPANTSFLDAIKRGEIPAEIQAAHPRREVNVNMRDSRNQNYTAPPTASQPRAFTGSGHRLGSPMPALSTEQTPASDLKDCQKQADAGLALNPNEPTTSIQVRLADGSRLVIHCNHTHTLADIRQYIVAARPEYGSLLFSLMTHYPTSELNDDTTSLKDLQLLNTSLILKLK